MRHNLKQVLGLLKPPCRLLAVVKADAYGFGALEASRVVLEGGAAMLGVTFLAEGLELRQGGIRAPVLVLAPPLPEEAEKLVTAGLTATVTDVETGRCLAQAARRVGERVKVHVKIDTGLGRLGVGVDAATSLVRELVGLPELEVEGIYSHLATTATLTRRQAGVFAEVCRTLEAEGLEIPVKHLCNSAATLRFPEYHWDMVRVGTLLYGQWPEGGARVITLKDPWRVKARLLQVRELQRGSRVGYGRGFHLRGRRWLGVIGLGYSDGLGLAPVRPPENWLELARGMGKLLLGFGRSYLGPVVAELNGRVLPLVGRLSMQLAVVDVSEVAPVAPGQEVAIKGLRRTAASAQLPRLYLSGGQAYRLRLTNTWLDLAGELGDLE